MKEIYKNWNEFWSYFWRVEHLHSIKNIDKWNKKLVDFIINVLNIKPGMKILDIACGGGDQALIFAQKGYSVTGIDISEKLINFARNQFKEKKLHGEFILKNMFDLDRINEFDACVILSGSFGYLDKEKDTILLTKISKSLKKNGKIFLTFHNKKNCTPSRLEKNWFSFNNGYVLTETEFFKEEAKMKSKNIYVHPDGIIYKDYNSENTWGEEFKCYSFKELCSMAENSGFMNFRAYPSNNLELPPKLIKENEIPRILVGEKA